jgi:hypothetical protein
VKGLARLISRLRYRELRYDRHPVIVIAGADIAAILLKAGISTPTAAQEWLEGSFKKNDAIGLDGQSPCPASDAARRFLRPPLRSAAQAVQQECIAPTDP